MKRAERQMDPALKPIGFAVSAVMAGLSAHVAATAPAADHAAGAAPRAQAHAVDPTNDPRRDEDASLLLGPSEPVEPFAEAAAPRQPDLFDL